jgi:hypothetical protein
MVVVAEETTIATVINTVKKDLNKLVSLIENLFGRSNPAFLLYVYAAFCTGYCD